MLFGKYAAKFYKKYWYLFLLGVITLLVVDYVQTLIPESLGQIVDIFQADEPAQESQIMPIVLRVIMVALGVAVGRVLWRITIFSASSRIEMGLREMMFLKSERLSQTYLHKNPVGNILNWFSTDIESVDEFLGWGTVMMVDAFFMSTIVIVKMFLVNWLLSTMILVPMLLIVLWGALVERIMSSRWEQRQKANDELYDFSQENITGLRVIKAFVKEVQQARAFAKVAWKNKEINVRFARLQVLFDIFIEVIIGAIMAMTLCLGGYLVYRSFHGNPLLGIDIKTGDLVSIVGYFATLIWPMMALGQVFAMHSRAKASLKRISAFLDAEEDIVDGPEAVTLENVHGEIEFRGLTFSYPEAKKPSLQDINLTIKAGETIGIVGKIGCGKSTMVALMARLYNIDKGTLFIDGVDIMDATLSSLRSSIAFVPQDNFLFSDEIRNNISFADAEASMDEIEKAAAFACVHDDIAGFPEGYKTVSGERGVTLSGGQKQRISIARAYMKNAPILVLDDSVSAVDVKTEETILRNIRQERKGKTTILIASRVSTVSSLDRIIVLKDGCLEAFDTPANLMKISPTYQKMVMLQELESEVS